MDSAEALGIVVTIEAEIETNSKLESSCVCSNLLKQSIITVLTLLVHRLLNVHNEHGAMLSWCSN